MKNSPTRADDSSLLIKLNRQLAAIICIHIYTAPVPCLHEPCLVGLNYTAVLAGLMASY